ncbi:hypothetical protein ACH5RR_007048 [Cinchona calisaya]|uniref:Uncharacterized protein n=1 Tax=Cinchona calisaya TaxID=153742 RepID=A0ABD3AQN8_9GENT
MTVKGEKSIAKEKTAPIFGVRISQIQTYALRRIRELPNSQGPTPENNQTSNQASLTLSKIPELCQPVEKPSASQVALVQDDMNTSDACEENSDDNGDAKDDDHKQDPSSTRNQSPAQQLSKMGYISTIVPASNIVGACKICSSSRPRWRWHRPEI